MINQKTTAQKNNILKTKYVVSYGFLGCPTQFASANPAAYLAADPLWLKGVPEAVAALSIPHCY